MTQKPPFWDVEESIGFNSIEAKKDGLYYKVWDQGTDTIKQEVAEQLANVRCDFNKLLLYLYNNPKLWINHPIAYGIIHTFDIHVPCLCDDVGSNLNNINDKCLSVNKLFNIQEMTPNDYGIIGLNKPKIIKTIRTEINGKPIDYKIAEKRSMFLTIRNKKMNTINDYNKTILLALHEITHTTCNDVTWKEDNHKKPYPEYHKLMRKWAQECGILK